MNLGELSIRRGVTTAMVYLCLTGFGFYTLYNLPVNRLPEVELPVIAVITTYTGAGPEDVETLITSPIERAVASVEGVEKVESTSRMGTSIVVISFTWGTDMDDAEVDVRKNIELFANDYPHEFPEVEATVLVAKHRLRRVEVPAPMRERLAGTSSQMCLGRM